MDTFTGYRLYTLAQLPTLNRVLALRDLGFSLEQIARLLDAPASSAAMIREMLVAKRAELHARIAEEQERLTRVEARLRLIEQEEQTMPADVIVKEVPPLTVATAREIVDDLNAMEARYQALFAAVFAAMRAHNWTAVGSPLALFHDPEFAETNIDTEIAVPVNAPATSDTPAPTDGTVSLRTLPGGTVVALVYEGPYNQITATYTALGAWMSVNGYRVIGPPREIYLSAPNEPGDPVTEVQFPVEKA